MSRSGRPRTSTTKETPHESCSKRGSYSPNASGTLLYGSRGGAGEFWAFVISHPGVHTQCLPWTQRDDVGPAAVRTVYRLPIAPPRTLPVRTGAPRRAAPVSRAPLDGPPPGRHAVGSSGHQAYEATPVSCPPCGD